MKKSCHLYLIILYTALVVAGCSYSGKTYRIGVAQCSEGNWRSKVNNEMLAAQYLYDEDVSIEIVNCHDHSDVQVRQIDSLLAVGVDLLVVAPNEAAEVSPALKRAMAKGVPVILFDRKSDSDDYTAFIGGDNVAVGRLAAVYAMQLATQADGCRVVEIAALQSTSPSRDRHKGFEEAMRQHPETDYRCIFGDWDDNHTGDIVTKLLKESKASNAQAPTIFFCHSDFMAKGAWRAAKKAGMEKLVKIIGVDGLPGEGEGIEAVAKGQLAGTCVYPTHGEQIVRLALDILTGREYNRENVLPSMMITPENVEMVSNYGTELQQLNTDLVAVRGRLEQYFGMYHLQAKILWASVAVIVLLAIAVGLTWRGVIQIRRAHRRQKAMNKEQTLFYTNASHQLKTPLTLIAGPLRTLQESGDLTDEQRELLEMAGRNVRQLEEVVADVLHFRKDGSRAMSDAMAADNTVQEERLNMMKQEDTDELPNILVIDDNQDMRRYLRTLLASRFYVMEAADGQQGLRLARESVPDLIVSDVMMPVMDGLQLCRQLKEDFITSHIPVILLTARDTEEQQMEGYEHGADAYLTKPFNADLLISRINNLLKSRQQLRTLFAPSTSLHLQPSTADVKLTTQDSIFMDHLKEAVRSSMANPELKMDDLGEQLGISRVQLYRKVKVLTGLSPVELLRQMRLERGRVLLNSTTKTVQEIAYEVGFSTPSYFSACYKKQYGKLPMEERADYQK